MFAVVAQFRVEAAKAVAFEEAANELVAATRAAEPTVLTYVLTRSTTDPTLYKILEIYEDKAAFEAHGRTEWLATAFRSFKPLLAERPVVDTLDVLSGG